MNKQSMGGCKKGVKLCFKNHRRLLYASCFFILVIAGCNFLHVNYNINNSYMNALGVVRCVDSAFSQKQPLIKEEGVHLDSDSVFKVQCYQKQLALLQQSSTSLNAILKDMECNKKGLFDTNTITFLSSFILVGLVAIFLGIDERISKKIKEYEEKFSQVEVLQKEIQAMRSVTYFFIKIQALYLIAIQINIELTKKPFPKNSPINEYIRMMDVEIVDMIDKINRGIYTGSNIKDKNEVYNIIDKILALLSLDYLSSGGGVQPKLVSLRYLTNNLQELRSRIELLSI